MAPSPAVGPTQANGVQHNIVQGPVRLTGGSISTRSHVTLPHPGTDDADDDDADEDQ